MQLYHGNKHTYRLSFIALRQVHQLIETVTLYKTNQNNSGTTCTTGWSGLSPPCPTLAALICGVESLSLYGGKAQKQPVLCCVDLQGGTSLSAFAQKVLKGTWTLQKNNKPTTKQKQNIPTERVTLSPEGERKSFSEELSQWDDGEINSPVSSKSLSVLFFEASSGNSWNKKNQSGFKFVFCVQPVCTLVFVFTQKLWSYFF